MIRLLFVFRNFEFEIAKIVQVTKTKQNEYKKNYNTQTQKQQKKQNKKLNTNLNDFKLKYETQIK